MSHGYEIALAISAALGITAKVILIRRAGINEASWSFVHVGALGRCLPRDVTYFLTFYKRIYATIYIFQQIYNGASSFATLGILSILH